MIVIGCSNSLVLARKLARRLGCSFLALDKKFFPDGEIHLRFSKNIRNECVVVVQSFQPNPQEALVEVLWAAAHARMKGATELILMAPYLGYMRQDKEFNPGEVVSAQVMGVLLSTFVDRVVTIDPHLHRIAHLDEVFSCSSRTLTANPVLAEFIKKKFGKGIIIGPDEESEQWAARIAEHIGWKSTVLVKTRYSSRHVSVRLKDNIVVRGKQVVIVDDIISTGGTVAETALLLRKYKPQRMSVVCVHGVFAEHAVQRLKKASVRGIFSTNTIENVYSTIDISRLLAEALV